MAPSPSPPAHQLATLVLQQQLPPVQMQWEGREAGWVVLEVGVGSTAAIFSTALKIYSGAFRIHAGVTLQAKLTHTCEST